MDYEQILRPYIHLIGLQASKMKTFCTHVSFLCLLLILMSHFEAQAALDCREVIPARNSYKAPTVTPQADLSAALTKAWYRDLINIRKKTDQIIHFQPYLLYRLFQSDPVLKNASLSLGFHINQDTVVPPDPVSFLKKAHAFAEVDTPLKPALILDAAKQDTDTKRLYVTNIYDLPNNFDIRQWKVGSNQYSNKEYFQMVDQGFFPVDTRMGHFYEHDFLHVVDFYLLKGGKAYAKSLRGFAKFALSLKDEILDGKSSDWFRLRSLVVNELLILPDLNKHKDIEILFGQATKETSIEKEKITLESLSSEQLKNYVYSVLNQTPALLERHGGAALDSFHFYKNQSMYRIRDLINGFENDQARNRASTSMETLIGVLREIYFSARQLEMVPALDNAYYLAFEFNSKMEENSVQDLSDKSIVIPAEKIKPFLIDRLARLKSAMRVGLAVNITADQVVRDSSQLTIPTESATYQFYNSYSYKFPALQKAFLTSPSAE